MHILFAEDSRMVALPVIQVLEQNGHRVTHVLNGAAAVAQFIAEIPDLVLMDVEMPIMGGIEATRRIKEIHTEKYVPVVMLTGLTSKEDLLKGFDAGADDYLTKPVDFDVLTARMKSKQRSVTMQDSKHQYDRLATNIPVGVYLLHTTQAGGFSFKYVSPRFCILLNVTADEVYRDPQLPFTPFHPEDVDELIRQNQIAIQTHKPFLWEGRTLINGQISWLRIESTPDLQENGDCLWDGLVTDITERKAAEKALRIASTAFETHEAILITDVNANIIRVNHAFEEITGYSSEEVLGENPRILSSERQEKEFYAAMWQDLLNKGTWTGEIWDKRKNGQVYPKWLTITAVKDNEGLTTEYVAIFSDITARKKAEEEIYSLAYYDALTNLPNRRFMLERLRQAQAISARSKHYGALLFLDMDKFKTLNDKLGHDYGDLFLVEISRRLLQCVREMDMVARIGGDEFVVLIEEIDANAEEASQRVALIAEKIRARLSSPYKLKDHEHHSSPSIGVSLYRGNEDPLEAVLKHADMAMYKAKDSGRNAVRFFDPAMQIAVETHAALEADLRHAVPEKQLLLYYQIQLDSSLRPLGAEALIRWAHPKRGMVSPMQFIPIAEESSLILDAGHWVLETACKQLALWSKREQTKNLTLAVNVSAQQFKLHDFVDSVMTLVKIHQINRNRLKLELTESVVLDDVADVITKMHALKALGVGLSLDDFGTGYSSLSYLKQMPLDQIKIDQSFVRDVTTNPSDAVMVQTIINLASSFRMNVIAEGVETDDQLNFLRQNGCMAYQGYLFSKPIPIDEFEAKIMQYIPL